MSPEQISGLILGIVIPIGFLFFFHGFVILMTVLESKRSVKYRIERLERSLEYAKEREEYRREGMMEILREIRREGRK